MVCILESVYCQTVMTGIISLIHAIHLVVKTVENMDKMVGLQLMVKK
jgi:hypothetical protein